MAAHGQRRRVEPAQRKLLRPSCGSPEMSSVLLASLAVLPAAYKSGRTPRTASRGRGTCVVNGLDNRSYPPPPPGLPYVKGSSKACQGLVKGYVKGLSRACQGLVKGYVKGLPRACEGLVKGLSRACQGLVEGLSMLCRVLVLCRGFHSRTRRVLSRPRTGRLVGSLHCRCGLPAW